MKKYYLVTPLNQYELEIYPKSDICKALLNKVPLKGMGINIGGEIYFNILQNIPYNGQEKEIFDKGDIVYWRAVDSPKFAIAIFYDNTQFGDWKTPQASGPSIKIAKIISNFSDLKEFKTGNMIEIIAK